jgi:hypothetical protein
MIEKFCSVEFLFIPDIPGVDAGTSPCQYLLRPKPDSLFLSATVTLLFMTSSVPSRDSPIIPARFRIFPNYDL